MYQLYGHIQSYLPRYIKGKIFKSVVIDYIFFIKLKKKSQRKKRVCICLTSTVKTEKERVVLAIWMENCVAGKIHINTF